MALRRCDLETNLIVPDFLLVWRIFPPRRHSAFAFAMVMKFALRDEVAMVAISFATRSQKRKTELARYAALVHSPACLGRSSFRKV